MLIILENSKNWSFTYCPHLAPRWHRKPWLIKPSQLHRPSFPVDHLIRFLVCRTVEGHHALNDLACMDSRLRYHNAWLYPNWDSTAVPAP